MPAETINDVIATRFYTVANVARLLGYCRHTISKWAYAGKITTNNMEPPRIPGWQVKLLADPLGIVTKLEPVESAEKRRKAAKKRIRELV